MFSGLYKCFRNRKDVTYEEPKFRDADGGKKTRYFSAVLKFKFATPRERFKYCEKSICTIRKQTNNN